MIAFKTLGGNGADALLLHGFGSDRLSWLATSPSLQSVARLHSLDLPGHGESGMDVGDGTVATLAERVAGRLDAEGLKRLHLIAHSLGGGIALLLARERPDLVRSLALIAPLGLGHGVARDFLTAYPEADSVETLMPLLQRLVVRPTLMGKQIAQRVLAQLAKPGSRAALRAIAAAVIAGTPGLDDAAQPDLPRLVIWGAADSIGTPSEEKLARFGGAFHRIENAAHLPHVESARAVNDLLAAFLAGQG